LSISLKCGAKKGYSLQYSKKNVPFFCCVFSMLQHVRILAIKIKPCVLARL